MHERGASPYRQHVVALHSDPVASTAERAASVELSDKTPTILAMHWIAYLIVVLLLLGILGAVKIGFSEVVRGLEVIADKLDKRSS